MSAPKCRRSFGRVFTISRPTARFCTSNFDLKVRKRTCQQICYGAKTPYLLRKLRFVARLIPIKCFLRKPSPVGSNVASNRRVLQAKRRGDHGSGNVCKANLQVRIAKYELCGFEVLEIYTAQTAITSSVTRISSCHLPHRGRLFGFFASHRRTPMVSFCISNFDLLVCL